MKAWIRWQDWTNVVLGAWLVVAPWALGTTSDDASSWNAWIVGSLVALVALWALAAPDSAAAEWTNVALGAWLIVAPFALAFTGVDEAAWNAWIVGAGVAGLALWAMPRLRATNRRRDSGAQPI
jgi:multisubunit Na+/H+ antiporter MnhE subunit